VWSRRRRKKKETNLAVLAAHSVGGGRGEE